MILVDEVQVWPTRIACFKHGSAHLTFVAPSTRDDLHTFAASIGLRREWFQEHSIAPHYDVTPAKRELALKLGATFVSARDQARARVAARRALK